MTKPSYTELNKRLIPLIIDAGSAILEFFERDVQVDLKSDQSPVTQADRVGESIILNGLSAHWPEIDIIAEEMCSDGDFEKPGELFFLVDALDGTKEFIAGHKDFTVNIALIHNAKPIFGLVFAPALRKLFASLEADRAGMALIDHQQTTEDLNDLEFKELRVREWPADGGVAVMSRSHGDDRSRAFLLSVGVSSTIAAGSSLKFCTVASGEADVYPRFQPTMEWDIAAGHAVLAAAGGVVVDVAGNEAQYGKFDEGFRNGDFIACGHGSLARIMS